MRQTVQLFKIWGIPVGFNSSWYLIFALIIWSLATGYMPEAYPELGTIQYWLLALITSLLFFGSVIFHELAHAYFALRNKIGVKQITLFIFGGVAEMEDEPKEPGTEFIIAIAGPISSLILAGFFWGLLQLDQQVAWLAAPTRYLMQINLLLAAFNMIPGFPLDGGRVFRAAVWYFTNFRLATKVASISGQIVAYALMGVGIFQTIGGNFFNGLWLIFIGWFLNTAAVTQKAEANLRDLLKGVTVERIMQKQFQEIEGKSPISLVMDEYILRGGPRYYFVKKEGFGIAPRPHPHGMLTMTDISSLERSKWGITPAEQIMKPWEQLITIQPQAALLDALLKMDENKINQLPVIQDSRLVGILTRENIVHFLRLQAQQSEPLITGAISNS